VTHASPMAATHRQGVAFETRSYFSEPVKALALMLRRCGAEAPTPADGSQGVSAYCCCPYLVLLGRGGVHGQTNFSL
jgi:hypothetical protein